MEKSVKLISADFNLSNRYDIEDYILNGGFNGLKKALSEGYENVLSEVDKSTLQGRGGANYPTGLKLKQAREAKGEDKRYVLCNADEGEPGTFKDKYLLTNGIFKVIEGIIIAAFAAFACEGYIYIREEYSFMINDILKAISEVYKKGFLGKNILSSGFNFNLSVFSGGGSYVCGEGFAMCESMEGKAGRPRTKPPYVKEAGLFKKPTLVINVETVSVITTIMNKGADEILKYGVDYCKGTKMICVSGKVNNPGVFEIPFGISINDIINLAGGIKNDKKAKFVQIGGASGAIIPQNLFDTLYTYDDLKAIGAATGSGAIVVADSDDSLMEYIDCVAKFFAHESCGKCVPCREGNRHLPDITKKLVSKTALKNDILNYIKIMNTLDISLCGSGKTQVVPFVSAYRYFSDEFKSSIEGAK